MGQRYPTDLTEAEWTLLAPLIPTAKPGGRPRTTDMREVVNAIFYVLRGGCQWRLLPKEFPPHQTVYHYCLQLGGAKPPPLGGSFSRFFVDCGA